VNSITERSLRPLEIEVSIPSSGLGNCRPKVSGPSGEASPAHGADATARLRGYLP